MVDLVTCKFDDDSIKMRALLYSQHFLYYEYMGKIFVTQGQVPPKLMVRSHPIFYDCFRYLKADKDPIENEGAILGTTFSPL